LIFSALALLFFVIYGLWPGAAHALDAPTPLMPPNGATTTAANYPPLGIPDFAWQPVAGATQYRLQLSQDAGFASKQEWTTANARFTPTDATLADGVWYWRVRVEQPAPVSAWSEVRSFTRQWATPEHAAELEAPADGATLDFYTSPAFSWTPVMGAAAYRFQIATSADGFAAPRYSQITLAPAHQPAVKLPNGEYYWRVVPLDAGGREGAPSVVRSFTASYNRPPDLLEPADAATPTFTPTFRWKAVAGAQLYRLQYTTDPTFHADITTVETRNTEYTPASELQNDVNYYWRVQVQAGNAVTGWSEIRWFRKQWYIQPELLTPVNNYQTVTEPFFSWSPVPAAGGYRFELHCVNSFPATSQCGWIVDVGQPYFALGSTSNKWMSPGIWYWRVTPLDGSGGLGKPSLVSSFVYSPTAAAPQLVAPLYYYPPSDLHAPHEDRTVALPIFTWHRAFTDAMSAVAAYRVQVDDDPLFGSVEWTWDTANLSAAPTVGRPFTPTRGVDYYWRVAALDGMGGAPLGDWSWSQRWRTRIDLTRGLTPTVGAAPVLLRPAHAAESVEAAPLLEWWPLAGATAYRVEISRNDEERGFAEAIVVSETVPYPAFAPAERLAQGTYYWRVRARRNGAIANGWTAAISFTLALPQPTGLVSQPASPAARAATLCWTPVVTPTIEAQFAAWKYRVQVSRDPTFSTEYDKADTEQACWTPTKGYPDGTYYWRVAAMDGDGKLGSYSPATSFLKQYPVTTLLQPAPGAPATSTPTFVWQPVPAAASYRLEVALSETFANLYDSVTTSNTRFTPTKKYDTSKTYFWRVAMMDKDGNRGPFTGDRVILRPGTVYLPLVLGR